MTSTRGRPLRFKTVEELKEKIEDYFNDCLPHPEEVTTYEYAMKTETVKRHGKEEEREVVDYSIPPSPTKTWRITDSKTPTITGLAVFLDTSRQTLLEYEGEVEGREKNEYYADTIKKAKDLIELHWEQMLKGNNVTGVIFNLKNNFKWQDKTEQAITNPDGSLSAYSNLTEEELRKLAQ